MKKHSSEAHVLDTICETIRTGGSMSDAEAERLVQNFSQRGKKALEALQESRIKKYVFQPSGRVVWIVVGKERDYLVMPAIGYCSCDDFYYQFDHGHVCYHIIAQKLAEASSRFDLFEDDDQLYDILIQEWKALEEHTPAKKKNTEENREDGEGTV